MLENRPKEPPSRLKQAAMQITAGGSAGFVEVCIMHPLDLVKTRLQIQTRATKVQAPNNVTKDLINFFFFLIITTTGFQYTHTQVYYNGVFDCFAKMYRTEGLTSLWKGILPPILAETPKRATKFVCFEQYKQFFMFGSDKATPLV